MCTIRLMSLPSAGSMKTQLTPTTPSAEFLVASEIMKLINSRGYFKGSSSSWSSAFDYSVNHDLILCALGGLIDHLSRLMVGWQHVLNFFIWHAFFVV